jgi:hypothetical protein
MFLSKLMPRKKTTKKVTKKVTKKAVKTVVAPSVPMTKKERMEAARGFAK